MTPHSPSPRSRRERPAKPALTRAGIVATAVELMRAEGLERVTMRRLAQELDTGPASLYVYVRNTAELHAAVLDELLGEVDLSPVRSAGDWRDRLARLLTSYVEVLFEHPALARSALVARPSGEHYLDLVEAVLALLAEGGAAPERAAWGLDLLLQYGTATAAEHSTRAESADAQRDREALTAVLDNSSPDRHPQITALGPDLIAGAGEARLAWGFQVLLSGIVTAPDPDTTPAAGTGADAGTGAGAGAGADKNSAPDTATDTTP
ncbi:MULTISPECIES: TetR/AcrR family transcriptional regulator [Streptomyces]|uniref:TetR-family transcriptional regulator n=3 Tax=Streptomyces avermitilis TaxID=33903 RepID=Q82BE5_STRAW|nr:MULTISPECIES: TetR/AcrR family transcriptional regulator C-terminal domain-containing protein [Streptomyces]MYT01331.1 TetR family transcriptional regulator [Streptomyces sp. SID5469]BAC73472.1 putative TetR-family transcriptional regulator [Streptomyces avermitilis MA-4680 = NBRC 14893]GDY65958.1 TetR family transcriptional regulator [Streptomyces avermitilis]GDY82907.1 TetR family transcriptional regulator [Streptomyces avermitilis]